MMRFPRYRYNPNANFAGGALALRPARPKMPGLLGRARSAVKGAIGGAKKRTGSFLSARPGLRTGVKKVAYGAGKVAGVARRKVSGIKSAFRPKKPRLPGTSFSARSRQVALFARIERDRQFKRRRLMR